MLTVNQRFQDVEMQFTNLVFRTAFFRFANKRRVNEAQINVRHLHSNVQLTESGFGERPLLSVYRCFG